MGWGDVGSWLKTNAGNGANLIGSLLTGNIVGAVSAGAALVQSATGETDPTKALEVLKNDPATLLRLKELEVQEADSIRKHLQAMTELELTDKQSAHQEQQDTIRGGDVAEDEYVRHTRPKMAKQAWYGTMAYVGLFEVLKAFDMGTGANIEICLMLSAPALAYLGFRSGDKWFGSKLTK